MSEIELIKEKLKVFDDKKFKFHEKEHKYFYGDTELISVTTFLKNFHLQFDSDFYSKKKAKELGTTVSEVLAMWKKAGDISRKMGSRVHLFIEDFLKGKKPSLPSTVEAKVCCEKFLKYYNSKMKELTPVALEKLIFDLEWGIAGTVDALFYGRGKLYLIDWKTNQRLRHDSDFCFNKMLLKPFGDLKDNEFNKYSIQVSLYRLILEKQGIDTEAACIIHVPYDYDVTTYKALDLRDRIRSYFDKKLYNKLIPDNELTELF